MTMPSNPLPKTRNIGIIAHIDAGKTTVTERILYYTGKEYSVGEVDDGSAHMDWMEEERERGITITSAATTVEWEGHTFNIIDTPGHVDFTCEVERALRALDGAIGIFDGVAGVEAQSETVWRQADHYTIPRIAFINKLDKTGANFDYAVKTLIERLHANPLVMAFPDGHGQDLKGVVDVLGERLITFGEDDQGKSMVFHEVPDRLQGALQAYREKVLEAACEYSESLMEQYLSEAPLARADVEAALREGVLKGDFVPIFCGAALRNKGIQPLMDAICRFLPSPLDRGEVPGQSPDGAQALVRHPRIKDHFTALVFKVQFDRHGDLIFARIYSGQVKQGDQVLVANLKKKERIGKIFRMHADSKVELKTAGAGDIVAFRGLKLAATGHTLCHAQHPILLEGIHFPETVVSLAIEPRNVSERDNLINCLKLLAREDPTFEWQQDEDTGQLIVKGMGELHLEVIVHRLLNDWKVKAKVGKPRVWYRQTVQQEAQVSQVFEKELGNKRHFAGLSLSVAHDPAVAQTEVTLDLNPDVVKRQFWPLIQEGLEDCAQSGGYLGFPWIQTRIRAFGGETRVGESSEVAFSAVVQQAFNQVMEDAGRIIMEPLMHFDIFVPTDFYGPVSSDLTRRRAEITETHIQMGGQRLEGTIPLSETFGYMNTLRSLTQGRASLTLEPSGFAPAPDEVANRFDF